MGQNAAVYLTKFSPFLIWEKTRRRSPLSTHHQCLGGIRSTFFSESTTFSPASWVFVLSRSFWCQGYFYYTRPYLIKWTKFKIQNLTLNKAELFENPFSCLLILALCTFGGDRLKIDSKSSPNINLCIKTAFSGEKKIIAIFHPKWLS